MLENKVYSFSELRTILTEEKNEFKPKYGKGYSSGTEERENEKAVKDMTKEASKMGKSDTDTAAKEPANIQYHRGTTLEYNYNNEPDSEGFKQYKERVKKEVCTSGENEEIYNAIKKNKEEHDKNELDYVHAGLKAHNLPKDNFKHNTLFTESRKMKRLHFKNTTFLNEEQMIKRIPEDYKIDGNKFIMKDSKGNEYLVECKKDALCEGYVHTNVLAHSCGRQVMNEALEKFNHLAGYKSSDYNKKVEQLDESNKYNEMVNITRTLIAEGVKKQDE